MILFGENEETIVQYYLNAIETRITQILVLHESDPLIAFGCQFNEIENKKFQESNTKNIKI